MTKLHPSLKFLSIAFFVVTLAGCGAASQTVNSTPTSPAAEPTPTAEVAHEPTVETTVESGAVQTAACAKLNLNDLTEDQLMATIPDFSSRMVREFFEYRPYVSIQQFRREIGKYVDDTTVAGYEQYVFVPVDPNNADSDTLQQIPGVDATVADALIAGRPYASTQAFLDVLEQAVNAQQLAAAACYLVAAA